MRIVIKPDFIATTLGLGGTALAVLWPDSKIVGITLVCFALLTFMLGIKIENGKVGILPLHFKERWMAVASSTITFIILIVIVVWATAPAKQTICVNADNSKNVVFYDVDIDCPIPLSMRGATNFQYWFGKIKGKQ